MIKTENIAKSPISKKYALDISKSPAARLNSYSGAMQAGEELRGQSQLDGHRTPNSCDTALALPVIAQ